jgi:hypothetical protein
MPGRPESEEPVDLGIPLAGVDLQDYVSRRGAIPETVSAVAQQVSNDADRRPRG